MERIESATSLVMGRNFSLSSSSYGYVRPTSRMSWSTYTAVLGRITFTSACPYEIAAHDWGRLLKPSPSTATSSTFMQTDASRSINDIPTLSGSQRVETSGIEYFVLFMREGKPVKQKLHLLKLKNNRPTLPFLRKFLLSLQQWNKP